MDGYRIREEEAQSHAEEKLTENQLRHDQGD